MRRFSTSVVAACVDVAFDDFAREVEFDIPPVRRGGVLGGLEHLWVGEFSSPWSLRALLFSVTSLVKPSWRFPLSGGVASLVGLNTAWVGVGGEKGVGSRSTGGNVGNIDWIG